MLIWRLTLTLGTSAIVGTGRHFMKPLAQLREESSEETNEPEQSVSGAHTKRPTGTRALAT